jgi:hypothetical protein
MAREFPGSDSLSSYCCAVFDKIEMVAQFFVELPDIGFHLAFSSFSIVTDGRAILMDAPLGCGRA